MKALNRVSRFGIAAAALFTMSAFADTLTPERILELKNEIRSISRANIDNTKEQAVKTRAELDVLVSELVTAYPETSAKDQLPAVAGSWKQLWSDDFDGESDFGNPVRPDKNSIFQYISKEGWFYNLSNTSSPIPGIKPLSFLRGKYEVNPKDIKIEFTKVSLRLTQLKAGESVSEVVEGVESGKVATIGAPGGAVYPKGPVGAQGLLKNIYLDSDFRLATGENLTFNKNVTNLYVLDRANTLTAK